MENMRLLKQQCTRPGYEAFIDLYLVWQHQGKTYCVRIRPQFGKNNRLLLGAAQFVPSEEPIEKYL